MNIKKLLKLYEANQARSEVLAEEIVDLERKLEKLEEEAEKLDNEWHDLGGAIESYFFSYPEERKKYDWDD